MATNARVVMQLNNLKGVGKLFPFAAAQVIAKRASQIAPRDTGYMAEHIHAEKGNPVQVISEAPYSGYVEYGTYKMAAQPFMRPAIAAGAGQKDILLEAAKAFLIEIKAALKR